MKCVNTSNFKKLLKGSIISIKLGLIILNTTADDTIAAVNCASVSLSALLNTCFIFG